ncbi:MULTISPECIES: ParB/RepB/Spo0J family partition protein [Bradyrhizobium]|uniref:ParB-like chromosome segregation protein Spo0J n=1 Tax=Bradyrhizobium japonicum TaxID=375 RepID=A0ABV2S8N1_BRAJP|nr:ParB/RepB/Spo0J family partition protein [Bradyrhizobium sp. CCBAU 15544]
MSCTVVDARAQATELSLVENIIRAPMHPADQFEAFRDVIDAGATITDVAARLGIAENLVTRRLKMGRLSPVILDSYRNGDIDLEQAEAFTLSDDREAQERVFAEQPEWQRSPASIRRRHS